MVAENSPPPVLTSSGSEWKRRFTQKRYLCTWILVALVPFIVLRLTYFSGTSFPSLSYFASSPSSVLQPEESPLHVNEQSNSISPPGGPIVESSTVAKGSLIRPDEDAWRTHDDWIVHSKNHGVRRKNNHDRPPKTTSNENDNSDLFKMPEASSSNDDEDFGLPEDNDKEALEVMPKQEQVESKEEEEEMQPKDSAPMEGAKTPSKIEEEISGECDLFDGDWEYDPEGPLYTNSTCPYIQPFQNCLSNGRPDTEYLLWRWKPRDCDVPHFDAKSFLTLFEGKSISFVGDSLARNQMQSLLCLLTQVETPTKIYKSLDDKTVRWLFEKHQITLGAVWSPYLLKQSSKGILGFEEGQSVLYLDELDTLWTSMLPDLNIVVLSIGQWYFKSSVYIKQDKVIGCHYCPTLNLTDIGFYDPYRYGVRLALEKVSTDYKGVAIMSTFAISHFENGTWDNGGQCRRSRPLGSSEGATFPGLHNEMHDIVISEFEEATNDTTKVNVDVHLEFLDVTKVSLQRADGHPGPYRQPYPFEGRNPDQWIPNDCLHWCLPGPVDTWNELLVQIVQKYM